MMWYFQIKKQAENYEQQISQLQSENTRIQDKTRALEEQISELEQSTVAKRQHEVEIEKIESNHAQEILELKKAFKEKELEYETQLKEYGDLEGQILDLQGRAGVSDDSIDASDKVKVYQEEIEDLKQQLSDKDTEIDVLKTGRNRAVTWSE